MINSPHVGRADGEESHCGQELETVHVLCMLTVLGHYTQDPGSGDRGPEDPSTQGPEDLGTRDPGTHIRMHCVCTYSSLMPR